MENINTAPVIEPENTLNSKKEKITKPLIFMILALILGSITSFSGYIINPIFTKITELIPADTISSYSLHNLIYNLTSSVFYNISNPLFNVFSIAVFFLFAYLAYKNLNKAMRFLGVVFLSTAIANLVRQTANTVVSVIHNTRYSILSNELSSVNSQLNGYGITEEEKASFEATKTALQTQIEQLYPFSDNLRLIISIISVIGLIVLGIILLLAFERKQSEKTEPTETLKKKRIFGLPEIFMLVSLFISEIAKIALYILYFLSNTIFGTAYAFIDSELFTSDQEHISVLIYNSFNSVSTFLYEASALALPLVILVLFAFFAYRKKKDTALFLGVSFVATKISWLFATGPLNLIYNLFNTSVTYVARYFAEANMDYDIYTIISLVLGILSFIAQIAFMGIGMLITVVAGVLILMAVTGKFKKKPKEIEETDAAAEIEVTETIEESQPVQENI